MSSHRKTLTVAELREILADPAYPDDAPVWVCVDEYTGRLDSVDGTGRLVWLNGSPPRRDDLRAAGADA